MGQHEDESRPRGADAADAPAELERVYWQTLREVEALLRPQAGDDAPPLAA